MKSVLQSSVETGPAGPSAETTARSATERIDGCLQAAAGGDRQAFRELYDATSGRLLGQALSMLRNRDAAEDALQDAYVRIWSQARHFDPGRGHAMPWMVRVLRNIVIDRMRRDRLMARYHVSEEIGVETPAAAEPVGDRIDLVRGLDTLAPGQRDAIVQVVMLGWTHDEASRRVGVPTPTSKARALRGLKRLRTLYESDAGQGASTLHG
jgi:RNA polymerase sigma-70 factor (ECF subfamily)